jgi:hypothetical protein
MSKQEKLAAFLDVFGYFNGSRHRRHLDEAVEAYDQWRTTPDDPPQKPEMPECVRELCELGEDSDASVRQLQDAAKAVRAHYAQPLKLEVGKVYEDDAGTKVQVVFENKQPGTKYPFLCVFLDTATPYYSDGFNLIREVPQ